jgi:crotonobetainyl-CoA:carnitine CoA-transferase CaiB-like acyl-CoA transferase
MRLEQDNKSDENITGRIIDIIAPIGKGQRALLVAPPKSGKTVMMQHIAHAISANYPDSHMMVLLVDDQAMVCEAVRRALAKADVLITSFRPSALKKLGIDWATLRRTYPALCLVEIVGAPDARAEEPGHDLTYLAEAGLVQGLDLPPTLYADMGGSLMASEAVLQARLAQLKTGKGVRLQVALSQAAHYLALPRSWGLTTPRAAVGGGHAGYRIYPCKNGRVAVAALEPHFAKSLCQRAGVADFGVRSMMAPATHAAVAAWALTKTRAQLDALGAKHDIPLYTLAA